MRVSSIGQGGGRCLSERHPPGSFRVRASGCHSTPRSRMPSRPPEPPVCQTFNSATFGNDRSRQPWVNCAPSHLWLGWPRTPQAPVAGRSTPRGSPRPRRNQGRGQPKGQSPVPGKRGTDPSNGASMHVPRHHPPATFLTLTKLSSSNRLTHGACSTTAPLLHHDPSRASSFGWGFRF
jgi:hypothetical protein